MRRPLIALLAFGVIAGYGSAIGAAVHHHRFHSCHGLGAEAGPEAWGPGGFERFHPYAPAAAPQAAAPQTVVVQPPAPAAAAPNVFIVMPGAAMPVVTPAAVAPAPQAP
jgi:hypothetical protein